MNVNNPACLYYIDSLSVYCRMLTILKTFENIGIMVEGTRDDNPDNIGHCIYSSMDNLSASIVRYFTHGLYGHDYPAEEFGPVFEYIETYVNQHSFTDNSFNIFELDASLENIAGAIVERLNAVNVPVNEVDETEPSVEEDNTEVESEEEESDDSTDTSAEE